MNKPEDKKIDLLRNFRESLKILKKMHDEGETDFVKHKIDDYIKNVRRRLSVKSVISDEENSIFVQYSDNLDFLRHSYLVLLNKDQREHIEILYREFVKIPDPELFDLLSHDERIYITHLSNMMNYYETLDVMSEKFIEIFNKIESKDLKKTKISKDGWRILNEINNKINGKINSYAKNKILERINDDDFDNKNGADFFNLYNNRLSIEIKIGFDPVLLKRKCEVIYNNLSFERLEKLLGEVDDSSSCQNILADLIVLKRDYETWNEDYKKFDQSLSLFSPSNNPILNLIEILKSDSYQKLNDNQKKIYLSYLKVPKFKSIIKNICNGIRPAEYNEIELNDNFDTLNDLLIESEYLMQAGIDDIIIRIKNQLLEEKLERIGNELKSKFQEKDGLLGIKDLYIKLKELTLKELDKNQDYTVHGTITVKDVKDFVFIADLFTTGEIDNATDKFFKVNEGNVKIFKSGKFKEPMPQTQKWVQDFFKLCNLCENLAQQEYSKVFELLKEYNIDENNYFKLSFISIRNNIIKRTVLSGLSQGLSSNTILKDMSSFFDKDNDFIICMEILSKSPDKNDLDSHLENIDFILDNNVNLDQIHNDIQRNIENCISLYSDQIIQETCENLTELSDHLEGIDNKFDEFRQRYNGIKFFKPIIDSALEKLVQKKEILNIYKDLDNDLIKAGKSIQSLFRDTENFKNDQAVEVLSEFLLRKGCKSIDEVEDLNTELFIISVNFCIHNPELAMKNALLNPILNNLVSRYQEDNDDNIKGLLIQISKNKDIFRISKDKYLKNQILYYVNIENENVNDAIKYHKYLTNKPAEEINHLRDSLYDKILDLHKKGKNSIAVKLYIECIRKNGDTFDTPEEIKELYGNTRNDINDLNDALEKINIPDCLKIREHCEEIKKRIGGYIELEDCFSHIFNDKGAYLRNYRRKKETFYKICEAVKSIIEEWKRFEKESDFSKIDRFIIKAKRELMQFSDNHPSLQKLLENFGEYSYERNEMFISFKELTKWNNGDIDFKNGEEKVLSSVNNHYAILRKYYNDHDQKDIYKIFSKKEKEIDEYLVDISTHIQSWKELYDDLTNLKESNTDLDQYSKGIDISDLPQRIRSAIINNKRYILNDTKKVPKCLIALWGKWYPVSEKSTRTLSKVFDMISVKESKPPKKPISSSLDEL